MSAHTLKRGLVLPAPAASGSVTPSEVAAIVAPWTSSAGTAHPAPLAFHCINNAAQILRGDLLDEADITRARTLLEEATVHVSALYLAHIRVERQLLDLRATSAFLQRDPSLRALTLGGK